jgi:hypothetical protein
MKSYDISHVPPPNPENYWWFEHRQKIDVMPPTVALQLIAIDLNNNRAMMNLVLNGKAIRDYLELDAPVVALRLPDGEPLLTLTLRVVQTDKIGVQVTYNQSQWTEVPRAGVDTAEKVS